MINILCVKWGTAYSSEYVNKLHSMISRHFDEPFRMFCLTDNSNGVIDSVTCLPIADQRWDKWWNKITLLNDERIPKNTCLLFDLDVVIYGNITCLLEEVKDNLTIAECYWVDPVRNFKGYNNNLSCDLNSSIMMWNHTPEVKKVYDFFDQNQEKLVKEYKGIDKVFYYYEFEHFEIATIKNDWIQSYHHTGFDKEKGSVLIFNQGIKQHEIKDKTVHELWQ